MAGSKKKRNKHKKKHGKDKSGGGRLPAEYDVRPESITPDGSGLPGVNDVRPESITPDGSHFPAEYDVRHQWGRSDGSHFPAENDVRHQWGRPDGNRFPGKNDVRVSKKLVSILRHKAVNMNIRMDANGFVKVNDLLRRREFNHITNYDIIRIVENNDKKRFFLKEEDGELLIRANQGHSIRIENLALTPILNGDNFPNVIHGTYYKAWSVIRNDGLRSMTRIHIHFAIGEPGERGVISGMRSSCQVMIYLNLELILSDGLRFFLSENNVILTEGDENGVIKPKYFQKVIDRKTRRVLLAS